MTIATGNVFTIPPGAPFLKVLAHAIADGRLIDGLRYDANNPLALAAATIYLPTRRAARVLRSEFVELAGGRSAILPVIRALGEVDDDAGFFEDLDDGTLDMLPPVSATMRLVELGGLILAWRNRLPRHISDLLGGSPLIAPASPADALWLAKSLAELIDAIETENADWQRLDTIEFGDMAIWWQMTGEFLKIARDFWPQRLAELSRSSPVLHRNMALQAEARRISTGSMKTGPMIVAGSTGSIPATAELIKAIAGLENGAVVLPGLDREMGAEDWRLAGGRLASGGISTDPASRSHPQYGLFQLLERLGVDRREVTDIGHETAALKVRRTAVTAAFAPAESAVNHLEWRSRLGQEQLVDAFRDIGLIEAANEREEAVAIAIALKLALEERGQGRETQVALVTPDRNLARRVLSELQRFGIEADDSAGTPLLSSLHGSLVLLTLESVLHPGDPVALTSLLKHPLVHLGRSRQDLSAAASTAELLAFRGGTGIVDPAAISSLLTDSIAALGAQPYKRQWQKPLLDQERLIAALELAAALEKAVEPLASMGPQKDESGFSSAFSFAAWAEATGHTLEALAGDQMGNLQNLWSGEAGDALSSLIGELMHCHDGLAATGSQWIDVMTTLLAGTSVKAKSAGHPRVFIWGTLEARLQSVDTLVLAGLNEGIWPGQTAANPFLSRTMKTAIGLEPPERRTGQSAHDFVMGLGSGKVILTRSLRQGDAPSVASRFLQRLTSVVGSGVEREMRSRGARFLGFARSLDLGGKQEFSKRPEPFPKASHQPIRYSFSEVGKLRRDPYEIYARRILRLDPLDPYNSDPSAAERGTIYHSIVERFIREGHDPAQPESENIILTITREEFDKAALPSHIDAVWRPRFHDIAQKFLDYEKARRPDIRKSFVELRAEMALPDVGIGVSGRADRIDMRRDGRADIIDYKTGLSPSIPQARSLLDPQLSLEAAALGAGAFKGIDKSEVGDLLYVRLKPGNGFKSEKVNNEDAKPTQRTTPKSSSDLAGESISQLTKLVTALRTGKAGFKSRLIPFREGDYGGDYDHLARTAEWSSLDSEDSGEDGNG
jgi:ATP-dependent helicase/nuclease subunit B